MRIAITGATGFLGSHLACRLSLAGHDVVAIKRKDSDMAQFHQIRAVYGDQVSVEWCVADIRDLISLDDAFNNTDQVVHCAGMVSFLKKDSDRLLEVNQHGTANVVDACLKANVKRLCHVSSTSVFPSSDKTVDESFDFNPDGPHSKYGLSKHLAELEVFRGAEEGLNTVIINPSIILGYGDWNQGPCKLFHHIAGGFRFYSTGANAFVGVEDVCNAIEGLLQSDVSGRYLCTAENLPFKTIFDWMAEGFGTRPPSVRVGKSLNSLAWRIASCLRFFGIETMITRESARSANSVQKYSSEKLRSTLVMKFRPIHEVITESAERYKQHYR